MKKFKYLLFALCFVLLISLVSCSEEVSFGGEKTLLVNSENQIIVDIKGGVKFPGIYSVDANALLYDVVTLAGGLLNSADSENINLATPISCNQMIVIPIVKEADVEIKEDDTLINLNTSTISELSILPGIGDVKAQNIIDFRTTNGKFTSIEQLKDVSGISETLFNKIKTMVTL